MSTSLENRVALWVSGHPGSTAREVALSVHARYNRVAEILVAPLFAARARSLSPSDRALGYWLVGADASNRRETPGDAGSGSSATQCARILSVLSDGEWHSSAEIHSRVFCVLHSRVAELRRRDHTILHSGGGGGAENHFYLWVREDVAEVAA